eukprot:5610452-Prorocentrum_lima.AAC.1
MDEVFPNNKIPRMLVVDSPPPVGWHDSLLMVLLTHMRARLQWLRNNVDPPAILVLCYLNRVL